MQDKKNVSGIIAAILAVLLVLVGIFAYAQIGAIKSSLDEKQTLLDSKDALILEKDSALSARDSEIAGLKANLTAIETASSTETAGYLIDGLFFEELVDELLTDREVKTLFDGKIVVGDETYGIEEVFTLDGLSVLANEKDFNGDAYLIAPRDSVSYKVIFDSDLNTSTIDGEDNSLVFNFLGKEIEIVEWNNISNEVTLFRGDEFTLNEGDSVTVDTKTVTLTSVSDNDNVFVTVDGVSKEISEGQTKTINGLEVRAKTVIFNSVTPRLMAILVIGNNVEETVADGDEFEEGSMWDWTIDPNSIGIVLNDEFTELDDELKPLASGETLCLPNEYVCVRYDGLIKQDTEKVTFELDTFDGSNYVLTEGNFQSGLNDYTRLYINSTGIYDKDFVLVGPITVGDFDSTLSVVGANIVIEDFNVSLDLNVSNVGSDDVTYRTLFGITVEDPENSIDEQSWSIVVPEERVESIVTVL